jgi:hypothetical protein
MEGRPTLRCLTVGSVPVGEKTGRHDVAVWGEAFPSWLPCLDALGLHATMVFVRSDVGLAMIQRFVDAECKILVIGHVGKLIELVKPTVDDVDTLLIDGGPTGEALVLAGGLGMTEIVSTRVSRRIPKGWQQTMIATQHEHELVASDVLNISKMLGAEMSNATQHEHEFVANDALNISTTLGAEMSNATQHELGISERLPRTRGEEDGPKRAEHAVQAEGSKKKLQRVRFEAVRSEVSGSEAIQDKALAGKSHSLKRLQRTRVEEDVHKRFEQAVQAEEREKHLQPRFEAVSSEFSGSEAIKDKAPEAKPYLQQARFDEGTNSCCDRCLSL